MKQCYMLTSNEKNFLKYTIINTLRLTTNRKGAFHYATDVVIADKPEYISVRITIKELSRKYRTSYNTLFYEYKKHTVTWFYKKEDGDYNKLLQELVTKATANYMRFENKVIFKKNNASSNYSTYTKLSDWSSDKAVQRIKPNEQIMENFQYVVEFMTKNDPKILNEKLLYKDNLKEIELTPFDKGFEFNTTT